MARRRLFTSESVTEGHPDKVADQISDAILDAIIEQDPQARVAAECLVTTGLAFVAGEITTDTYADIPEIVRKTIEGIGYVDSRYGLDHETCAVVTSIDQQSADIAMGVDTGGAGDQGMMFGYATRESQELMPLPIILAHRLTRRLAESRKSGQIPWLRPDGKSQVTVEYEDDRPVAIQAVVVSAQHDDEIENGEIRDRIGEEVIKPALPPDLYDAKNTKIHINPTGRFVTGGPQGDAGLTGRKIIPFSELCCSLDRQEHRRRPTGRRLRGATRLRDRRGRPGLRVGGYPRHRSRARRAAGSRRQGGVRPDAAWHYRIAQSVASGIQAYRRLRALRS